MLIIGIERVDYVSKKTGNPVKGYTFYCVGDRSEIVGGQFCESYFVSDDNCRSLLSTVDGKLDKLIGVDVRPYRNRYGNVEQLDRLG